MARRLFTFLAALAGLVVAALIAGGAYMALKAPLTTQPNSNLQPENCTPGPCRNISGFTIWISNVKIANDVVHMTVKFRNSSTATHVSPEDLTLIDSGRRQSIPISDASGCKTFVRHDFDGGAYFGPLDLCFRVSNATPPFILHWTPYIADFCCQEDITIWPS